ncbi:sigma-54-dependent transcriptional regulator [Massilia sp. TN1-12]|uniref:sigma-54-dependent transcriptional regulator n=1 Tax=Massilia paldalensis TaxID=3377675 RepID=UPI00384F5A97
MAHLLIVDDDDAFRDTLAETLLAFGHDVAAAASGAEALALLASAPPFDAIFLDHRMPGMDGLETLAALRDAALPAPPVIVLTAFAGAANTIEAMRLGAFDHLSKPVRRETLRAVLDSALQCRPSAGAATPAQPPAGDGDLVGSSDAMREVHKQIGRAAASVLPVLVLGETGTGKEVVARALHRHSARAGRPFVAVNCAAIPGELLESELFGHVRGAFTGAAAEREGCFRAADGGVLLLDEIGDMPLDVQAKILRVLQEGEVVPLGSNRAVRVDVRIIAATHRDLGAAVRDGQFRADLLYRLDVLPIRLPPLRERPDDIIPLAELFLQRAAAGSPSKLLGADAAQRLLRRPWPGNARELRNAMERCHARFRHDVIGAADLDAILDAPLSNPAVPSAPAVPEEWLTQPLPLAVERLERLMLEHALTEAQGNRAEAARRLGIHRQLLYRKLAQYGIDG